MYTGGTDGSTDCSPQLRSPFAETHEQRAGLAARGAIQALICEQRARVSCATLGIS
tara:strand:- start:451 stop:618 length:168 start_codon:yes stop_codon:yes gene_type:complete